MSFLDGLKRIFGGGQASNGDGPHEAEMISCMDALSLVQEYLDGELEGVSQEQVKAHFDVCGKCYPHLKLEEAFRGAVHKAAGAEKASPELRARIQDLLAEAAAEE